MTAVQLAATVTRLAVFAYLVLELGQSADADATLLAIGYIPFLAFLDVGVQAYARAAYLRSELPGQGVFAWRVGYARACTGVLALAMVVGEVSMAGLFPFLLVGIYAGAAVAQLWERWLAAGSRPLICALAETGLLAGSVVLMAWSGPSTIALLAGLASMPLARLVTHAIATGGNELPTPRNSIRSGWRTYAAFSVGQQFAGALAATLPTIYAQATGDYSTLARNLVAFRLVHSGAAMVSTLVNSIASRIFFGTAGATFERVERLYVSYGSTIGAAGAAAGLVTAALAWGGSGGAMVPVVGVTLVLAVVNLQSSLLLNRGMPARAFLCQLLVLWASLGLLVALAGPAAAFPAAMVVSIVAYVALHHSNIQAYRQWLSPTGK